MTTPSESERRSQQLAAIDATLVHAEDVSVRMPGMADEHFTDVWLHRGDDGVLTVSRGGRTLAWFSQPWAVTIP